MSESSFSIDVEAIRERARSKMDDGPVTSSYGRDVEKVIGVLNDVLATEIVCWMRYTQNAIACSGIDSAQVAEGFHEHGKEERQHAMQVAERVSQLGGQPDFDPETLVRRSHTPYSTYADTDLTAMLKENLYAERIVIQSYQDIIRWLGNADPTSRRLMEKILAEEEDHADDLTDLLGI
ncbi:ferritin-like domain-containing protein [Actinomadura sp. KC216]|uniref:ferritin-like domain-containing protein n=1 Tax=Actinomadura sp. KC216 TaxID=2530370 RepID=UPI001044A84A|nr:ferritin-like domain-containing protein [Actinomadura sp. KC216]TDB85913.1 ferritin-like domain-containing protein [Actinomadura sp. KC216]